MALYKIAAAHKPTAELNTFIGDKGELFYSEEDTRLRISDGVTQGGIIVTTQLIASDGTTIIRGADGDDGLSAYEIAVNNGFIGTEVQWLASLEGADGADGETGPTGPAGADGATGADGDSAYQIAVNNGFVGTEAEWLASLQGTDGVDGTAGTAGTDGASAYQIAVNNGFSGTESEWLTSLGANIDLSALTQSIVPATADVYDLGATGKRWRDLYLSGNTLYLGDLAISRDPNTGTLTLPAGTQMEQSDGSKATLSTTQISSSDLDLQLLLEDLINIDVTNRQEGSLLQYKNSSGKWTAVNDITTDDVGILLNGGAY